MQVRSVHSPFSVHNSNVSERVVTLNCLDLLRSHYWPYPFYCASVRSLLCSCCISFSFLEMLHPARSFRLCLFSCYSSLCIVFTSYHLCVSAGLLSSLDQGSTQDQLLSRLQPSPAYGNTRARIRVCPCVWFAD